MSALGKVKMKYDKEFEKGQVEITMKSLNSLGRFSNDIRTLKLNFNSPNLEIPRVEHEIVEFVEGWRVQSFPGRRFIPELLMVISEETAFALNDKKGNEPYGCTMVIMASDVFRVSHVEFISFEKMADGTVNMRYSAHGILSKNGKALN